MAERPSHADPTIGFVFRHPAHWIAFGFGVGCLRPGPGTWGTLLAVPATWWLLPRLGDAYFLLLIVAAFWLGVWVCGVTARALGVADYGGIVWDEIVAFMLVLFFVPTTHYGQQAFAFLLFRLFDIIKIPPARQIDLTWKTGLGVMADDMVAAFYTILVLAVWQRVFS